MLYQSLVAVVKNVNLFNSKCTFNPNGESCQRTVIFTIELTTGQALSSVFMNASIIVGLVYEHMNMETMVVKILDAKATFCWFFPEGEEVEKICSTL